MKVRYLGKSDPLELLHGKVYEVLSVEDDWYRMVDETGEDYLYPPQAFEIVVSNDGDTPVIDCSMESSPNKDKFEPTLDMFDGISLRGRFAYACLCIESKLRTENPDADWAPVAKILWEFADGKLYWDTWADHLLRILPSVYKECPDFETYSGDGHELDEQEYSAYKALIEPLSEGASSMIESLFEMTQECEGTNAQHGIESSIDCFTNVLQGLRSDPTGYPAIGEVAFLSADERDGYGRPFNGTFLSSVLEVECPPPFDFPNHCAKCGGDVIVTYEPMLQTAVCERCGEIAIADCWEPIDEDQTEYSLAILAENGTAPDVLRAVAKMAGINFLQAKAALGQGNVTVYSGKAKSIADRAATLQDEGISFSIEPDFPYSIPHEWGMSTLCIGEGSRVRTLVEKEGFPAGSVGVVASFYGEGPGCEVEIWGDNENPLDVVTFDASELVAILD